jgi:hypothetical protein
MSVTSQSAAQTTMVAVPQTMPTNQTSATFVSEAKPNVLSATTPAKKDEKTTTTLVFDFYPMNPDRWEPHLQIGDHLIFLEEVHADARSNTERYTNTCTKTLCDQLCTFMVTDRDDRQKLQITDALRHLVISKGGAYFKIVKETRLTVINKVIYAPMKKAHCYCWFQLQLTV